MQADANIVVPMSKEVQAEMKSWIGITSKKGEWYNRTVIFVILHVMQIQVQILVVRAGRPRGKQLQQLECHCVIPSLPSLGGMQYPQ